MAKRKTTERLSMVGTHLPPTEIDVVDALAVRARLKGRQMTRSEVLRRLVELGIDETLRRAPITDAERAAIHRWFREQNRESQLPDLNRRPTVYETVAVSRGYRAA